MHADIEETKRSSGSCLELSPRNAGSDDAKISALLSIDMVWSRLYDL